MRMKTEGVASEKGRCVIFVLRSKGKRQRYNCVTPNSGPGLFERRKKKEVFVESILKVMFGRKSMLVMV